MVTSISTQVNYTLDENGSLTSDGLRTFGYDAANRLSQVQIGQNRQASKITYLHNAQGLRVFKSEPQLAQTAPDEEELGADFTAWLKKNFGWLFTRAQHNATLGTSFVYDDAVLGATPNLLGEYSNGGAKNAGRMEYIWLPTESGQAIPVGLYRNNRFYAIHSDHLGTPRLITDDANKPVWQWAYSAFGDNQPTGILKVTINPKAAITNQPQLLKATTPAITVNLRFPGQYADEESNLFENGFRSYRPGMGAYDQFDPIGLAGGWNRRGYVGENALMFSDPLGLNPVAGAYAGAGAGSVFGPVGTVVGGVVGAGIGAAIGWNVIGPILAKPPENAYDPNGPKAPGRPTEADGFKPKGGDNWVPNPNPGKGGSSWGWEDSKGDVWCPTGQGGRAHGDPHWDIQSPGGGYRNKRPQQ